MRVRGRTNHPVHPIAWELQKARLTGICSRPRRAVPLPVPLPQHPRRPHRVPQLRRRRLFVVHPPVGKATGPAVRIEEGMLPRERLQRRHGVPNDRVRLLDRGAPRVGHPQPQLAPAQRLARDCDLVDPGAACSTTNCRTLIALNAGSGGA